MSVGCGQFLAPPPGEAVVPVASDLGNFPQNSGESERTNQRQT